MSLISSSGTHRALEHSHTATQLLSIVWDRSSDASSCTPSATTIAAPCSAVPGGNRYSHC